MSRPEPRVTLRPTEGGFEAVYEWHRWRFLLSSGDVVDVRAVNDSSDLREAVLGLYPKAADVKIMGSTLLAEPEVTTDA